MKLTTRLLATASALSLTAVGAAFGAHRIMQQRTVPNTVDKSGATLLPNGWKVSPAGSPIALPGDMPLTMLKTPDGKYLIVNTGGYHDHSVSVIDLATSKCVQSVDVVTDWTGMSLSPAGDTLYLSSGGPLPAKMDKTAEKAGLPPEDRGPILAFHLADGHLTPLHAPDFAGAIGGKPFVAGITTSASGDLYFANIQNDTLYKVKAGTAAAPAAALVAVPTGRAPYGVALSPDGTTIAVSNWDGQSVSLIDAATMKEKAKVTVGSHPNQLIWGKDGRLFVANSGSNSVSVIHDGVAIETIKTTLTASDLVGATPDALALSPDGKRLYVANADNNDVAVIDTSDAKTSRVLGFLPTGWYPSALAVSDDGRRLFVGTAKGLNFRPNPPENPDIAKAIAREKEGGEYIANILSGHVSAIDLPDADGLAKYTRQVMANVPRPPTAPALTSAVDPFKKIKHIVYIIRENRTYDQVFGDVKEGNGSGDLCLFGDKVTPNAHAIARNYVLLDNLYCNGEVSQDGHQWCDAAYATDYTEKAWPIGYSGRTNVPDDDDLSQSPAGYLWDNCARHCLSYRTYGEASSFKSNPGAPPTFRGSKSLNGHASYAYSQIPPFTKGRDLGRADVFVNDLHEAEAKNDWPSFMVMSLGEDHTQGLTAGDFSPFAHVGANDVALGKIVDAVSHSKFWAETAIFVIEDDAQNGPDHVDAHRTVGLVISPYVRHGVDSTMYTTASFVRTMELILGLPPMTQFDANATPLYNSFTATPNLTAYNSVPPQVNLTEVNPKKGAGAVASAKLDLTAPDRADPDALNAILWQALRPGRPQPAPVRSAFALSR